MNKKIADVHSEYCVACGACQKICPKGAVKIWNGVSAAVNSHLCVGCGLCKKTCPAQAIIIMEALNESTEKMV